VPKHRYNWIRDPKPQSTDPQLHYQVPPAHRDGVPQSIDPRAKYASLGIEIYDQLQEGSCTGNAWAKIVQYLRAVAVPKLPNQWTPSRQFIYFVERLMEGDPGVDGGAMIATGAQVLLDAGVPPEAVWPYTTADMFTIPPKPVYAVALPHKIIRPALLDNTKLPVLLSCLASGYPFVAGFNVYSSFESDAVAASGVVPMPDLATEQLLGGHAVAVIGYDGPSGRFICPNSWGPGWGQGGYFTIPFAYFVGPWTDVALASDFHMAHGSR
jgi:C1A family cysteine protease